MTVDQVIALSASLAAAVSAFATFLTVREMQKQRELAYRPDLIVLPVSIEATVETAGGASVTTSGSDDQAGLLTNWDAKSGADLTSSGHTVAAALTNIGVGGAKNVNIVWDLPIEPFSAEINAMARGALTRAFYQYRNEMLDFNSESLGRSMMMWGNTRSDHIDYVLPAAAQGSYVALRIPYVFTHLVAAYLFFFVRRDKGVATPFRIPPLSLTLVYSDIAGVAHRAAFAGAFQPIAFSRTKCNARLVFTRQ